MIANLPGIFLYLRNFLIRLISLSRFVASGGHFMGLFLAKVPGTSITSSTNHSTNTVPTD